MIWPTTIPLPSVNRKHQFDPRSIVTEMESGRIRSRRIHEDSIELIDVTWNLTEDQFDAFKTFFETDLENGYGEFEWEEIGTLAFWEATYAYSRTDNLYVVNATLEVTVPYDPPVPELPDLFLYYEGGSSSDANEDGCRSYFTLEWEYTESGNPGYVQTAKDENGPWYDYIVPKPSGEQDAVGVMTIVINNQFNGGRWFRIVDEQSDPITKTVNPLASSVPLPEWNITNLSQGRGLVVISAIEEIYQPYSYKENPFISTTEMYVEPLSRLEWSDEDTNQTQIVSVSNMPVGGSWKWTRTGAVPETTTFIPKYGSEENNLACARTDFGMVVKVRCFHPGGCASPLAVIAVDKRFNYLPYVIPTAPTGPGTFVSGTCDLPKGDNQSGDDCDIVWGGQANFKEHIKTMACVNSTAALSSGHRILVHELSTTYRPADYLGWESYHVIATRFRAETISAIGRNPFWNEIPVVCEYLDQAHEEDTQFDLVAVPPSGGLAGDGGTFARAYIATDEFIEKTVLGASCSSDQNVYRSYTRWDYLLSVINEEGDLTIDFTPDPIEEPSVDGDDFEEYDDTVDVSLVTLNSGTGWTGAWVTAGVDYADGYDYWIDTGFSGDDYSGGMGWEAEWTITGGPDCYDYFEDYEDDSNATNTDMLNQGAGWAEDSYGFQHPWSFGINVMGEDDFQSYDDDADVSTTTALGGGTGWVYSVWAINQ